MPARLTAEQAAWVLNCQPHDMPALVAARLLRDCFKIQKRVCFRLDLIGLVSKKRKKMNKLLTLALAWIGPF
ncbi:MAG: hypothetical protein KGR98_14320 [Verrucomicrobia bacterium]|nr:hypothetical protein [Verrucomicrobiota bacterium]